MAVRITPLGLDGFERLPEHARRCVFWEVDPHTLAEGQRLADPEFEKEAWLSMIMLEWGSCGQVATETTDDPQEADESDDSEQPWVGYALYAPPRAVPRALRLPTGPVSADAILLTSLAVEPGQPEGVGEMLIGRVVNELVRRGVRALEAFGRTPAADELSGPAVLDVVDAETASAIAALGDCSYQRCMIEADFLIDAGFTVIAPHRYFPRLRLELDKGLGWKAGVEAALERLLHTVERDKVTLT